MVFVRGNRICFMLFVFWRRLFSIVCSRLPAPGPGGGGWATSDLRFRVRVRGTIDFEVSYFLGERRLNMVVSFKYCFVNRVGTRSVIMGS